MLLVLVVAGLVSGPSVAQTAQQQKICADLAGSPPTEIIAACSALIEAGRLPNGKPTSAKVLAEHHLNRGIAYQLISDFERAIADEKAALPVFPGAQTLIDRLQISLNWLRYLKEIQDDNDYPNWSRPPFDGYWAAN